jgi:hypothetical protein
MVIIAELACQLSCLFISVPRLPWQRLMSVPDPLLPIKEFGAQTRK